MNCATPLRLCPLELWITGPEHELLVPFYQRDPSVASVAGTVHQLMRQSRNVAQLRPRGERTTRKSVPPRTGTVPTLPAS